MKAKQQVIRLLFIAEIFIGLGSVNYERICFASVGERFLCHNRPLRKRNRRDSALFDFRFSERAIMTLATESDDFSRAIRSSESQADGFRRRIPILLMILSLIIL